MTPQSWSVEPDKGGIAKMLWRSQIRYKAKPIPPDTSFAGQTGIISGANVGIGLESARMLLGFKLSRLVMAVRSVDKGEAAAKQLRASFPKATIEVWHLDMESYKSVQDFASKCQTLARIDFVILKAAVGHMTFTRCESTGHEGIIQVNYLSTALLTILLLPVLKSCAPPTGKPPAITVVSSGLSLQAKFPERAANPILPAFDDSKAFPFDGADRYSTSKLIIDMFVATLAEHVDGGDVTVNCVDPGYTKGTSLNRHAGGLLKSAIALSKVLIARPIEDGASTYVDAIMSGKESHGSFLIDWGIHSYPAMMYGHEGKPLMKRLWEETMKELEFANAQGIVASLQKPK